MYLIVTVPSKYWRAYDLHNKPRGLYSEEEKKLVALDDAFYDRKSVTVSNNKKLGSTLRRILGSSMKKRRIESEPLMMTYPSHFIHEGRHRTYSSVSDTYSSCSSIRTRSSSESSTDSQTSSSSGSSCCGSRKQVHFAPETVFCERNPKSSFWRDFLEKRRAKAIEEAQKEEMLRPRPFLPYLESGLSYHDDEEFYRLKYSDDHRNAQLRMMQRTYESRKKNGGSCRQVFLKALRTVFCCGANTEFTERSLKKVHGGHGPSKQRV